MTAPPPPPDSLPSPTGNPDVATPTGADAAAAAGASSTPNAEVQDKLQLTVLIAMPNADQRRYSPAMSANPTLQGDRAISPDGSEKGREQRTDADDEDEEEIPEVVFGITEVLWDAGADWQPRAATASNNETSNGQTGGVSGGVV